jgi:energy-coupling factor transport system substrate-specific component
MEVESRPAGLPLHLTRIASFVAVGLVAGVALVAVPNVELVTAVCFSAGFLLGPAAGMLTGALTESLFAGFNPMGSSFGILLVGQVIGMVAAGLLGSVAAITSGPKLGYRYRVSVVGMGILATLFFDLVTNLIFPIAAGFTVSQTMISLGTAVPFAITHLVSNAVVFSLIVQTLLPKLKKAMAVT